jgi:signal transduction histidine kinase/CHASE2 domain-containing sensor protein
MMPTLPNRLRSHLTIPDRARAGIGLRVGLLVALLVLLMWWGDLFVQARLRMNNIYYVARDIPDKRIIIVALDDASLQTYGRSLTTWPRTLYADLVDQLSRGGARVIAFDVLFSEPTSSDQTLIDAITRARTESEMRTRVVMPLVGVQREPASDSVRYTSFLAPTAAFQEVAALGHTSTLPDADGTVRHQPTRITAGEDRALSFGIVTYLTYLRIPAAAYSQVVQVQPNEVTVTSTRHIPVDRLGQMWINYFGAPDNGTYPVFSFQDVLDGRVNPDIFYDRIVLVGLMHHTGLNDTYPVPIGINGSTMSGVEIHANVIETLLQNKPLHMQSRPAQAVMIVALAVLSGVLYSYAARRWWWLLVAVIGALIVWFGGVFLAFNLAQQMVNLLYSLLALVLPVPAIILANTALETQRRSRAEWLRESIVTASAQQLSLERMLPGIAADLSRLLKTPDVAIWLKNAGGESQAYPADDAPPPDRQALVTRAIQRHTRLHESGQLAAPIIWQGRVLGAFWAQRQRRLSPTVTGLLDLFTWQTASVLANATLYAQTEELSALKTRMIRMASHDLKNPLTAVLGYTELLFEAYKRDPALPPKHLGWLENARTAAYNMLAIVEDILDLERVRGQQLQRQSLDLLELLKQSITEYQAAMDGKQHTFTALLPDTFPAMSGDPHLLREAVNNLLSNAIKYTPPGGMITLRLTQTGDHARISVTDTGFGIAPDAQKDLFREFYRIHTPQTAGIEGTGLGLSLVKAIVDAHAGRVWVNCAPGMGSTFYAELPLTSAPDADAPA